MAIQCPAQIQPKANRKMPAILPSVVIRFAGDSGDGMQLSDTAAHLGNDISTLPDYPSEIRAPAGTVTWNVG
jgi:hypothetical protein